MLEKFNVNDSENLTSHEKSIKTKIPNAMNIVMIFCIIIAALISMGEISFSLSSIRDVSLLAAIIYLITSVVYRNNYQNGMYYAMGTAEYKDAKDAYEKAKEAIYKIGIAPKLSDYCVRYREEELKNYRTAILSDACIPYDKYEKDYIGKTKNELAALGVSFRAYKCIERANKATGIKINTNILMTSGTHFHKHNGLGMSTSTRQKADFIVNMASRLITALLSGVVAVSVIIDPSWQTVAQWAIRMLPVVWSAIVAYNAGVKNISDTTISYVSRKTEILKIFISWHERKESVNSTL